MSHYALALSLGHNSSAVAIKDGDILGGYEEERFSQIKSDSQFPIQSIKALKSQFDLPDNTDICVSHWFLDGNVHNPTKYWQPNTLLALFPDAKVHSLEINKFSHHDAHKESAKVFAGPEFTSEDYYTLVMDGFGTAGEVMSIYHNDLLISRVFGFQYSLGMFYQYSTAYIGMKMNQDEYKQLAYETRIVNLPVNTDEINNYIDNFSRAQMNKLGYAMSTGLMDPMVSLDALTQTQMWVNSVLDKYLDEFNMTDADLLTKRILVSYFSQRYVETMVLSVVQNLHPKNLLVVGGLFYNVKLNHLMAEEVIGKLCVMPLAGDQGAGLGVYNYHFNDLVWPEHLFWGHRDLDYNKLSAVEGIVVCNSEREARQLIAGQLRTEGFVNIVRGSMEYGPRALCNTSTLALPDVGIATQINKMNERTNEMPFALVCTKDQAYEHFEDCDKIHKSLEYMICTRIFHRNEHLGLEGGAHYYPLEDYYTCRPQITNDLMMIDLLNTFGPLINTSWNFHGMPIVRGTDEIIYTHNSERLALPDIDFKTIVIKEI